jgi:peptide/nickel transport system substrate-binding protein
MYAPWFSNMPGFNNPAYWNYQNPEIDILTQKIYSGNFTSPEQRKELIRKTTTQGINESVRIFLASKIDPFVANKKVDGIINDFGGGITTRFTPINARTDDLVLKIGVKQIYQGAWNPVKGFGDAYSKNVWDALYDPGIFKNPYSGQNFAVRQYWNVETAGPDGTLQVPNDAINWNPSLQKWVNVGQNTRAISKITYDLIWSNWHYGQKMDLNDVLYSVYFLQEWGAGEQENDKTFDPEYTPTASQFSKTLVAIKPIDDDTIEVYVNYWHFDESEIADWGGVWVVMPWELMYAMEQAVLDGKASFSRTDSQAKGLNWLSLVVPRDAMLLRDYLVEFAESKKMPLSLSAFNNNVEYYDTRYVSAIKWINEKNHAVVSNGPFYLASYSPEARTITITAFDDPIYPFEAGYWSKFEDIAAPKITKIAVPDVVTKNTSVEIPVQTIDSTHLYYFISDATGGQVDEGILEIKNNRSLIPLSEQITAKMNAGSADLKIYAISESVLRPDIYSTSFLVVEQSEEVNSETVLRHDLTTTEDPGNIGIISISAGVLIIGIILYVRKSRKLGARFNV